MLSETLSVLHTKKACAHVTPEICAPTILWMNTSDMATFDSASSNVALGLADERFRVNCELERSHVTSCTMKSGVHPDADGGRWGGAHIFSHAHRHMSSDHTGPHPAVSLQQCHFFQHNLSK